MKQRNLLEVIVAFVLGEKYYCNIYNRRGTMMCEISSYIFPSRAAADEHRKEMEGTVTFQFVETISFRSRNKYRIGLCQNIKATLLDK